MFEGKRQNICITTSFDKNFQDIGAYAAMTIGLYAACHHMTARVMTDINCDRPPAWHRVKLIPSLFDEGFDFVLWIDADAVFSRFDVNIYSLIKPDKDLYLVQHDHPRCPSALLPNTGVMLVRNCGWSRQFFERLWSMVEYIYHPWWENAALLDLLGYKGHLGGEHKPNEELLERVEFIDERWNHVFIGEEWEGHGKVDNPIITHFAGTPPEKRKNAIPREALKSAFQALSQCCVNHHRR